MSSNEKVTLTFKAGTGFDAPWLVIHGDTVDEAGAILHEIRTRGIFQAVRAGALEFQSDAPVQVVPDTAAAVQNVKDAIPGSQELPESLQVKCGECGAATKHKTGHSSKAGKDYSGDFCQADPNHRPVNFRWR